MERYTVEFVAHLQALAREAGAWVDCQVERDGVEADLRHAKMDQLVKRMTGLGALTADVCQQLQDMAISAASAVVCKEYAEDFGIACDPRPAAVSELLWERTTSLLQENALAAWARAQDNREELQKCEKAIAKSLTQISESEPSRPPSMDEKRPCRMRIIAVNDVYELKNFGKLKSLIVAESQGFPAGNVVTTMAGDFLGPSLLSSLDSGSGMVRMLNLMPVDYVCFGNHEPDVPYSRLLHRISEFNGGWLNSNMPDFEPQLPRRALRRLKSDDGTENARTVAFTGFCIGGPNFGATYREDAFGGAHKTMINVVPAAVALAEDLNAFYEDLDGIIPITHQDQPEDVELAKSELFPVIVGGHDHDVTNEVHGERKCPVVKAGMDAENAAIIDVVWKTADRLERPEVTVTIKPVKGFDADPAIEADLEKIHKPVKELEMANIYELQPGQKLTSNGVKFGDASMARLVATGLRDCLGCDAAVVNSGAVRGKQDYDSVVSYGDLKKECPYPTSIVVTQMPFEVFRNAVKESRRPWWDLAPGEERKEGNSAFQVDHGTDIDENHVIQTIGGREPDFDMLYSVGCDVRYLKKNKVLEAYCAQHPERVQPEDAGRPVLPILVEYFCSQIWKRLLDSVGQEANVNFVARPGRKSLHPELTMSNVDRLMKAFDSNGDGSVDINELSEQVQKRLGEKLSSKVVVEQMISMMDVNSDKKLESEEVLAGLKKIIER